MDEEENSDATEIQFNYLGSGVFIDRQSDSKCEDVITRRRKMGIKIHEQPFDLILEEYIDKDEEDEEPFGFDLILKSQRQSYYLQVDSEKFKGFSGFRSWRRTTVDDAFNHSIESLLKLFNDTFFEKKSYCSFSFLVKNENDDESDDSSDEDSPPRSKRRKKMSGDDPLYLYIKISTGQISHLVENFSYVFTFMCLPNIPISKLPDEIMLEVFKFLRTKFLLTQINCVCKRFHCLVESDFMFKKYFLRIFPDEQKLDLLLCWKENIFAKFRSKLKWTYHYQGGDKYQYSEKEMEDGAIEWIDGSQTHAVLMLGGWEYFPFATNCYVSDTESHEWIVKLTPKSSGTRIKIGIVAKGSRAFSGTDLGWETSYGLSLRNGGIRGHGSYVSFTNGGWTGNTRVKQSASKWEKERMKKKNKKEERKDYGLFNFEDGDEVKMTLSKGRLSFEYGKEKHKVSCEVIGDLNKKVRSRMWSLCVDPSGEVTAKILSFKKLK